MAVNVIKAERVVRTMLGVLERDSVLSRLMWRNPAGDFRGAKGDAITIKVPAYTNANRRDLRAGTPRTKSNLTERRVIVTLDTDLYKTVPITDEELTLDIESFNDQIVAPVASSLVRGIEDDALDLVAGATYQHEVNFNDYTATFNAIAHARRLLNDSRVPEAGRVLAIGSGIEERLITDPQFARVDQSGSDEALRRATIGRVAGTDVITVPGLPPDDAYMFHQTAYALSYRAPFVPRGAPWGATMAWEGFALRVVQAIDPDEVVDNFHADVWTGTNTVRDYGSIDSNGFFVPSENPNLDVDVPIFVRAVRLTAGS